MQVKDMHPGQRVSIVCQDEGRLRLAWVLDTDWPSSDGKRRVAVAIDRPTPTGMLRPAAVRPYLIRTVADFERDETARLEHAARPRSPNLTRLFVPHVYFVQEAPDGFIKIGWTRGPVDGRLCTIQTGNPRTLVLLTAMRGALKDEQALHRRFAAHRVSGEWFHPAPELLAFIDEIKRSTP